MKSSKFTTLILLAILIFITFSSSTMDANSQGNYTHQNPMQADRMHELSQNPNPFRVAIVFATGGLGDLSFNDYCYKGAMDAKRDFGANFTYVEPMSSSEYYDFLLAYANHTGYDDPYDLIIGLGFDQATAMESVAAQYPNQKFAIVDWYVDNTTYPNVASLLSDQPTVGALVGAMAGLMTKQDYIGFIGGADISLITEFRDGYFYGANYMNPGISTTYAYTYDFANTTKMEELANYTYNVEGVDIIFGAAGKATLGMYNSTKKNNGTYPYPLWNIGIDAPQMYLGTADPENPAPPTVTLTSALKRTDIAVRNIISHAIYGTFTGGEKYFTLENGGIDYELNPELLEVPENVAAKVEDFKRAILNGSVIIPGASTGTLMTPVHTPGIVMGTTDQVEDTMDPARAYYTLGWQMIYNLGSGLVDIRPESNASYNDIIPALATDWTNSSGGTIWDFNLRTGVTFADGKPFNSTVVKYSFDRSCNLTGDGLLELFGPQLNMGYADIIDNVTITGDYSVRFYLKFSFGPFLQLLSIPPSYMVHPSYAPKDQVVDFIPDNPRASHPNGLGPYILGSWTRDGSDDVEIRLEKNPQYWNASNGYPKSDSIIIRFYEDSRTLESAITTGEVSIAYRQLTMPQIESLQNNSFVHVWEGLGPLIQYICLQQDIYPFNETLIRRGIAAALNRTHLCETVFKGHYSPLFSIIPSGLAYHKPTFEVYGEANYTYTQDCLNNFGYNSTNKLFIDLYYETSGHYQDSYKQAILIKSNLEASGVITITLYGLDWTTYRMYRNAGIMPMFSYGWYADFIDADNFAFLPFASWLNIGYNSTYPQGGIDQYNLWLDARTNFTDEGRETAYHDLQDLQAQEVSVIPLWQGSTVSITRTTIDGVVLDMTALLRFWLLETLAPEIDSPQDIQYQVGDAGHTITWSPMAEYPDHYEIQRNDITIDSGFWTGSQITINVDGLAGGTYGYTLTIFNGDNQSVGDTVWVCSYIEGSGVIVFDYSHGQNLTTGSYQKDVMLGANLTAMGYTVVWAKGGINSSILANADALIIGSLYGMNTKFTATEISAIANWFDSDNKFLWIGCDSDYVSPNTGQFINDNMTLILEAVGSHVYPEPTAIYDSDSNCGTNYRVAANGVSNNPYVSSVISGVDKVLMHAPTLLYGSNSASPGENIAPVALESIILPNVYPLLYYSSSAEIIDCDLAKLPYAHSEGSVGVSVAVTLETKVGAAGTSVLVVSGASPYGDWEPMYSDEYYGVELTGQNFVRQVIHHGVFGDFSPPTIMFHSQMPATYVTQDDDVVITVNVTDLNVVEEVKLWYNVTFDYTNISMVYIGNNQWSATIPQQSQGEIVFYKIYARDELGNWAVSPSYYYNVYPSDIFGPDISIRIEPDSPTSGSIVTVTANVTDPSGVTEVKLSYSLDDQFSWINVTMIYQTGNEWSATIPQQAAGVTVYYKIYASDSRDNWAISSTESYTVQILDTSGPNISSLSIEPVLPTNQNVVTVTATITDSSGLAEVTLSYSIDNQISWNNVSMTFQSGNEWTATIPQQSIGITVHYKVHAKDEWGNWATSSTSSYTVIAITTTSTTTTATTTTTTSPIPTQPIDILAIAVYAGGGIALVLILLIVVMKRKPKEKKPKPEKIAAVKKEVQAFRGGEIVGGKFEYKIKIKNDTDYVINNVIVTIVAYPEDCMSIDGSTSKKIARIEPSGFRSPQFVFSPTKDCVEGRVQATVSYVDYQDETKMLSVEPYTIRSVCDLLKPLDATMEEFDLMLFEMAATSEEFTLDWNPKVLVSKAEVLLPMKNFQVIESKGEVIDGTYRGVIRGLAQGKYTNKRVAVRISVTGDPDGDTSKVVVEGLGDDEAMLPTTIHELAEGIEAWICLNCGAPLNPNEVADIKTGGFVTCRYCTHTLTSDLYKKRG